MAGSSPAGDRRRSPLPPALGSMLSDSPIRAMLLPVHVGGAAVGTLHAYTAHPHEWQDKRLTVLTTLGAAQRHVRALLVTGAG